MPVTHCIFDMDGLLLDTERVYSEVTSAIVGRFGKEFPWSLKSKMMGRKELDAANLLIEELGIPMTSEEYLKERNAMQESLFPSCRPLPGVEKLIKHLKAHGIPIAVGTSSHKAAYELKTSQNKPLFELFDKIVCGDNPAIIKGKPSPDIFQEAARQLGNPNPENCLVFEDAISGVEAGLNADMKVVWVPDTRLRALSNGNDHGATVVLDSLLEFHPEAFGLPPYPSN